MLMSDPIEKAKEAVGRKAAELVEDGMQVGLGTGSTVHFTIVALGERRPDILCVSTSERTTRMAEDLGLRVVSPDEAGSLDIAIDGADEVDPALNLIKGGGGAHLREKIVAQMARRFVVVVDESKLVPVLGAFGLPLEVLDYAPKTVSARVRELGARDVTTRPERSDSGNLLLDARFESIPEPAALAASLASIPGLVEHGLFLGDQVERVLVAGREGVREMTHG